MVIARLVKEFNMAPVDHNCNFQVPETDIQDCSQIVYAAQNNGAKSFMKALLVLETLTISQVIFWTFNLLIQYQRI